MKPEPQLLDRYLDDELNPDEQGRLAEWLAADAEHIREFVCETSLHRQIRETMLARPYHAYGRSEVESAKPKAWQSPVRWLARQWGQLFGLPWSPALRGALALAACLLGLACLSIWWFGAVMGEPVLTGVKGVDASVERGTEFIPAADGMGLQPADVLRLGTNASATIAFGAEKSRLELNGGTELKLVALARGKRFVLGSGKIKATVARQRPFQPMVLVTPQAEARVLGTEFSLLSTPGATRLEVAKGKVRFTHLSDSKTVEVGAGRFIVAASNYVFAVQPLPGKVLREVWLDLPGDTLQDLRYHARFPNAPSGHDFPPNFETHTNWPGAYGTRMRAYLLPPTNGNYEFRLPENIQNGQFALWLSPDEEPADKQRICQTVFTRNRPGDPGIERTRASNQSGSLRLEAGKRYYIEALHKYGAGEDRLSVLWKRPDRTVEEPIPSDCLAPYKANPKEKPR